ncbi:g1308 [Coccomyxa viridis]|uniref:Steroid 5-alpha-reductase DET2 n=1 Tax=Coccomyxa viridis TaxID=1274662 RepID=A0ABP1FHQ6_9CHLO
MAVIMMLTGVTTFTALIWGCMPAGYGRYAVGGSKLALSPKVAWLTQEMWSFIVPVGLIGLHMIRGGQQLAHLQILLAGMFLVHYAWRSFAYPLLSRGGNPTPVLIWLLAVAFCMYNGLLQGCDILAREDERVGMRHMVGSVLWAIGWGINLHSDHILRNLRKPGESGYKIPRGGCFEYVSGANYLGEMLEWCGYAVAAGSLPAAAFACFTICNIGPRGWQHHQWYKERFPRYPKHRKAVIPFLL